MRERLYLWVVNESCRRNLRVQIESEDMFFARPIVSCCHASSSLGLRFRCMIAQAACEANDYLDSRLRDTALDAAHVSAIEVGLFC